jgi:UDP:flavonoid glycosyltransferase YjiC (YdhE family)
MGHAARMVALAEKLDRMTVFSSWGEGKEYIRRKGFMVFNSPSVDIEWSEQGRMAIKKSVSKLPRNLSSFALQILYERAMIKRLSPSLVISDSRLSSVIASRTLGVASILITNQLRIALPLEGSYMQRFLERSVSETLGLLWNMADEVLAPDLPPPYTISEYTLLNLLSSRGRIKFIGFMVDRPRAKAMEVERALNLLDLKGKKLVYAQISGPKPTRRWLFDMVLAASKHLAEDVGVIVSMGDPEGPKEVIRSGNIRILPWNELLDPIILVSDLIISRGGHSTIGKCILAGKPMVLIPIAYHGEQINNSKKVERLGLGKFVDPVKTNPKHLAEKILMALDDEGQRRRALAFSELALRYDAFRTVKETIFLGSAS